MLEKYYTRPTTVDGIRGSWIASAVEQYVSWMTDTSMLKAICRALNPAANFNRRTSRIFRMDNLLSHRRLLGKKGGDDSGVVPPLRIYARLTPSGDGRHAVKWVADIT